MPPSYASLMPVAPLARLLKKGWRVGTGATIMLQRGIDWSLAVTGDRSWSFHLVSLDLIDPLLAEHAATGEAAPLELAIDIALEWWAWAREADQETINGYDMAVGMRAWRLSYAVQAGRLAGIDPARLLTLETCLLADAARLEPEATFAIHSNHGFFQAAGLLALSSLDLADSRAHERLGLARLKRVLTEHFTADGVHREHSPDYHYFLHLGFAALKTRGLLQDGGLVRRLDAVASTLAWFVDADGRLVNFGDSDNRTLTETEREALGPPPPPGLKLFRDGGYAILRTAAGGYLAQTACFHSKVHKQADDLSLIWRARGRDVLIDAGRLKYGERSKPGEPLHRAGFRYTDPKRVYVESVAAHNTLEITGGADARRGAPYGSAIVDVAQTRGVVAILTQVLRPPFTHRRLVIGDGDGWLIVIDGVPALRRPLKRQWHHLGPEWTVEAQGAGFLATAGDDRLAIEPLTSARREGPWLGQAAPDLRGWWSPKGNMFDPTPALAFSSRGPCIATSLTFGDFGSTIGEVGLNGRLCGTISLRVGDGRRVTVSVDGAALSLAVEGAQT